MFEIINTKILYDKCENMEQLYDKFYYPLLVEYKELKKQLEEYKNSQSCSFVNICKNVKIANYNQQKKFIKYLENYIKDRNETRQMHEMYSKSEERLSSQYFILQEILQKYKEIVNGTEQK